MARHGLKEVYFYDFYSKTAVLKIKLSGVNQTQLSLPLHMVGAKDMCVIAREGNIINIKKYTRTHASNQKIHKINK